MERRNSCEKIRERTTIERRGFRTLHRIPRYDRAYFRLISLAVSCWTTNAYCLLCFVSTISAVPPFSPHIHKAFSTVPHPLIQSILPQMIPDMLSAANHTSLIPCAFAGRELPASGYGNEFVKRVTLCQFFLG